MGYNFSLSEQNKNAVSFDKHYPNLNDVKITIKYWDRYSSKYQSITYGKQHVEMCSYVKCPREGCTGKIWIETPIKSAIDKNLKIIGPYTNDCRKPMVNNNKVVGNCDIDHHEIVIEILFKEK